MKYNNVGFNSNWASSISEDAFVQHESHHGLTEEQLREAHRLMTGKQLTYGAVLPKNQEQAVEEPVIDANAQTISDGNNTSNDKAGDAVGSRSDINPVIEGHVGKNIRPKRGTNVPGNKK